MDLDEFSDDGFDDLTDHALQELERNAIRLTQAQCQPVSQDAPPRPFDCDWGQEDEDLDTTEVINHVGHPVGRPVVDHTLQQQIRRPEAQPRHRTLPQVPNPRWNPNVDPAKRPPAPMSIRAAAPPNPHFAGSHPFQHQAHGRENAPSSSSLARPLLNQSRFSLSQASQAQPGDVVSALEQRVRALKSELNAARGEASILRTKSTKAQHEHDIQLAQLKTSNADQLAEKERLVEAAMAAQKRANTELQFLQRDMKEFSNQSRRKNAAPTVETGIATPHRASKSWRMADGFHEMDLAVSPSKGQTCGRTSGSVVANIGDKTPSKGKRKRLAMDSPVAALDTHTEDVVMADGKHTAAALPQNSVASEIVPAAPFEFLQLVLDHGTFHGQPVTFDILSRFSFPSDPTGASLASMIFEKLPLMGNTKRPMQLLVDFVEHVISLWARCVDEQFWEPVKYLVSLVSFTFDLHTISVAPHVILQLVPVARSTIILVAQGRRRGAEGRLVPGSDDAGALEAHLDTSRVLSLLQTSALACATTPSETENGFEYTAFGFWKLMSLDMVLLLLSPEQRLSDIIGMLDLLATSALPGSLGPVSADLEPAVIARAVIGRVSAKLTEQARNGLSAYRRRQVRLAALRTLVAFSRYPFGALQLAAHSSALPRLVTCLSGAINDLYDQPVPLSTLPPLPDALVAGPWPLRFGESGGAPDLYRIISLAILLLHALVTDPATASVADIGQKLSLAYGTSQRYLLALGRLTFAEEDQIIEAGIDSDAVEAAHELLELSVTPDEGETISEAFGA